MLRLKLERIRHGWSQSELSRRSGVNGTTISLTEVGRFIPSAHQLAKLAAPLQVRDPRSLLDDVDLPKPK